jgi:hypothetical protein
MNGVVERMNRNLNIKSTIHATCTTEAVSHSDNIINRIPSLSRDEVITRIKPAVSTLRLFGCVCYAFVPKEQRATKLDPTSILGIYLGYSKDSCCIFWLFNPVTKNCSSARNFHVLEDSFIHNVRYINRMVRQWLYYKAILKKISLMRKRIEKRRGYLKWYLNLKISKTEKNLNHMNDMFLYYEICQQWI